jgi:hypothetical protein
MSEVDTSSNLLIAALIPWAGFSGRLLRCSVVKFSGLLFSWLLCLVRAYVSTCSIVESSFGDCSEMDNSVVDLLVVR